MGDGDAEAGLDDLGLLVGDTVRFRRGPGRHWHEGTVRRREADGSVGLLDDKRAARAIAAERLEVRVPARGGGYKWRPVLAGTVVSAWPATAGVRPTETVGVPGQLSFDDLVAD